MKTYLVGGAVRDLLLGIEPKDKDYVVVGSTPEEMILRGFKQVGADFPVFLHPETGEEYALARVERKVAAGYQGFETDHSPEVTLEEDLRRRDLTINAMAWDEEEGKLYDFFGGQADLKNHVLRHTSDAFREDPVRILRIARFAARYNFTIHIDTLLMMEEMVNNGEFDSLVPERVWAEFDKGLREKHFWQIWCVLDSCGALKKLPIYERACYSSFEAAADESQPLIIRCAAMFKDTTEEEFHENRIPSDIFDLALTATKCVKFFKSMSHQTTRKDILNFYMSVDLFRRTERFWTALTVVKYRDEMIPEIIMDWANKVLSVNAGEIALACKDKKLIKERIEEARIEAMKLTDNWKDLYPHVMKG